MALSSGQITIQWIHNIETYCAIQCIVTYQMNSASQSLSDRGRFFKALVTLSLDYLVVLVVLIQWIIIYPLDSTSQ